MTAGGMAKGMRKKSISMFIALTMVIGILSGCGAAGKTTEEGKMPEDSLSDGTVTMDEASDHTGSDTVPVLKNAVMEKMGCRVGAAATEAELNDRKVWEIITTHFNALTLGNELKPDALFGYSNGRCPGTEKAELDGETITVPKIDYSRAERMLDKVCAWNESNPENKIMVRGHVLVWHSQTPEWFSM